MHREAVGPMTRRQDGSVLLSCDRTCAAGTGQMAGSRPAMTGKRAAAGSLSGSLIPAKAPSPGYRNQPRLSQPVPA